MSSQKKLFAITGILLVSLFFVGAYFFKSAEKKKTEQAVTSHRNLLVRDYSPTIGNSLLKVTVVEFLDPECETCAFFHPLVKNILKKHDGRIRYVIRYAPFHPNSKFIIKILEAARRQGKYWETLDLLFEKLPEWGSHHNPQPELVWTYLPQLGLDIEKLKVDMKDKSIVKMIEQEIEDGNTFGVRKTPTFFVNGKPLESFGLQQLEDAINSALQ